MKCLIFAVFLFCIYLPSSYSRHVQFYRKDYTYIKEFDAFYKVHWDLSGSAWNTAFLACDEEGATLFYPKVPREWTLVKNLTDQMKEVPNVTDIFVGLHDEFKIGELITVDGHSTPYPLPADGSVLPRSNHCISMNIDTGKFKLEKCLAASNSPLPFVCKKVDDDVSCPTVDHGYRFLTKSKKCYKINKNPRKWQEAMKTCFMEGGILAVIENSNQAEEIRDILKQSKSYFVGVKKLFSDADYYTVKGQKFSDMYQNPSHNGQNSHRHVLNQYNNVPDEDCNSPDENGNLPDENGQYPDGSYCLVNVREQPSTDCGTVFNQNNNNLYTEIRNCDERLPFICEMEISV